MKHSNPAMRKPSLGKVNFDLSTTKLDTSDTNWYVITCPECQREWTFLLKDIPDRIIKCPSCGWEEVFFKSNFKWETYEEQTPIEKERLKQVFGTDKIAKSVDVEASNA